MLSAAPFSSPAPASAEADETVWMRRIAVGDGVALRCLMERWKRPLLGFLQRLVGAGPEAEDLALEVFVRLHRAAPDYAPTARFSTYLFAIAQRLALNELRRRRRKPAEVTAPEAFEHVIEAGAPAGRLAELEEVFQRALELLPPKSRAALLLIVQQQLSYEEAALALHSTPNAVRVLVHRARQDLKLKMEELS